MLQGEKFVSQLFIVFTKCLVIFAELLHLLELLILHLVELLELGLVFLVLGCALLIHLLYE